MAAIDVVVKTEKKTHIREDGSTYTTPSYLCERIVVNKGFIWRYALDDYDLHRGDLTVGEVIKTVEYIMPQINKEKNTKYSNKILSILRKYNPDQKILIDDDAHRRY